MKLSDYVIDFLVKEGVGCVFEFIGGAITHMADSMYGRSDIACVAVHHEQAAAFAAEAYARSSGSLGVAMATSGPGALNLLTGIGSCYFDSVPCLFITGQVNTYEYKFDRPLRQLGFQETDIVSVVKPLTKYAEMVVDPTAIRYHLEKAVYLARSGRPGPVLLDLPMNVQRAGIEPEKLAGFCESEEFQGRQAQPLKSVDFAGIIRLLANAKRPVVLAGGGVRTSGACEELQRFLQKTGLPVVTSLMGLDAVPHDSPNFLGMIGAYGNRYSNLALANADFLLILGSRLDTRQTGTRPESFARGAVKVQVDIDPHELDAKVKTDIAVNCDLRQFVLELNRRLRSFNKPDLRDWYALIQDYKERFPCAPVSEETRINPNRMMEILSRHCRPGDIICLDVGQNQMWAAQSFKLKTGQRMLISGGMGAMGFALPAALGAAKTGRRVIVISGDGGIQVNSQELDTLVQHNLSVKVFVMNNSCLGMVRQFQDMYFEGRWQATVIGYNCPDLVKLASAYGVAGTYRIDTPAGAEEIIARAMADPGPAFIEVRLEQTSWVNPKLTVNHPIEDMSPHLDREELQKLMLIDLMDSVPD